MHACMHALAKGPVFRLGSVKAKGKT